MASHCGTGKLQRESLGNKDQEEKMEGAPGCLRKEGCRQKKVQGQGGRQGAPDLCEVMGLQPEEHGGSSDE